jgi:hypothetical protein
MNTEVNKKVTFGVGCVGNVEALYMCLASVLNAVMVPGRIQVRFEGPLPAFGTFYMEQLAEFARFRGVDFLIQVASSKGVRAQRDWQLDNCRTPYLWMGDDDVVYDWECLEHLSFGIERLMAKPDSNTAYLCGTKGDLNNRRGWGNFRMDVHKKEDVYVNCPFNWFYDKEDCASLEAEIYTADTGNIVFDMEQLNAHNIRFSVFPESVNSGGEDTIFALECRHQGLEAYMIPSAQSFHLEKPKVNFSEHAARAEMVLRAAQVRGYSGKHMDYVKRVLMPWVFGAKGDGK